MTTHVAMRDSEAINYTHYNPEVILKISFFCVNTYCWYWTPSYTHMFDQTYLFSLQLAEIELRPDILLGGKCQAGDLASAVTMPF